jgi:small subunit ribosomal protein S5
LKSSNINVLNNNFCRNYFGSPALLKRPIKPTPAGTQVDRFDATTVRHYLRSQERMENEMKKIPEELYQERKKTFWPTYAKDIHKIQSGMPGGQDPTTDENELTVNPGEHIDFDRDEDFAKAISYVSHERMNEMEVVENHAETTNEEDDPDYLKYPIMEIVRVGRHAQITAAGRIYSFSALVLLGTKRGCAGLGYGRGNSAPEAISLAKISAKKRLLTLDLWRGNNIGADIFQKYRKSWVWLKNRRPGNGLTCPYRMRILLEAFGIEDVIIGKGGSSNKANTYKALFKGLKDQTRSPEKIARNLGRKYFNSSNIYYNTTD